MGPGQNSLHLISHKQTFTFKYFCLKSDPSNVVLKRCASINIKVESAVTFV